MLLVITRAVHIGACMILLSLFAFELLFARPACMEATEALRRTSKCCASSFECWRCGVVCRDRFRHCVVLDRPRTNNWRQFMGAPGSDSIGVAITQTQFGRLWTWRLGLIFCLHRELIGTLKRRSGLWSSSAWKSVGLMIAITFLRRLHGPDTRERRLELSGRSISPLIRRILLPPVSGRRSVAADLTSDTRVEVK